MALFAVNTGLRDSNVCGLQWQWEVAVPEVGRSVFVIPPEAFKTKRPHVVILNDVAWSIIRAQRGLHPSAGRWRSIAPAAECTEQRFTSAQYRSGEHRTEGDGDNHAVAHQRFGVTHAARADGARDSGCHTATNPAVRHHRHQHEDRKHERNAGECVVTEEADEIRFSNAHQRLYREHDQDWKR